MRYEERVPLRTRWQSVFVCEWSRENASRSSTCLWVTGARNRAGRRNGDAAVGSEPRPRPEKEVRFVLSARIPYSMYTRVCVWKSSFQRFSHSPARIHERSRTSGYKTRRATLETLKVAVLACFITAESVLLCVIFILIMSLSK